ncbi:AsmA-like C-terminal region-containing protein [Lentilitoribacter sp. Alg239-R112]|uniref:AsmA family protein n=1 Tax=Lentilitoribacter sp. Alg239-R112 TaxID=2305987 RepID=UPI0013A6A8C3|nr:AsmA-like C-terminal region-containing protein [Lentilitoribacter sp. Alg239-R112]
MILVRLFIFFGGLLALGLIALLVGPYFIDWSDYRSDFQKQASRILGQKVIVNGDAELRILPFPSLTFNDLTVGENASGQPMMTAKQFEADLEITPFLSGEILIFDMKIVEPDLTVTLLEDGTLDWALRSEKQLAGNTLVLENIIVSNGKITLVDLQNQRRKRVSGINATLAAPEISGPWNINGSAILEDHTFNYTLNTGIANEDGHIRLRSKLSIDGFPLQLESEGDAKIINNKPSYLGKFSVAKQSDKNVLNTSAEFRSLLSLNIKGEFKANSERLDIPTYRLTSGKTSDPYIVEGKALIDTGSKPEFSITAKGQQIDLTQLAATKNQEKPHTDITSGFIRLSEIAQDIPIPDMPGQIDLSLPAVVAGQTTIREVELRARPMDRGWYLDRFEAKLPGRTSIEARGSLQLSESPSFEGNMLVASRQPSGFSSWLIGSVDPVIRKMGTAGFSANVLINEKIQRLENLELILGTAIINGKAERQSLPKRKPSLTVNLIGDEIDLDRIAAVARLINLDKTIDESGGLLNHDVAVQVDAKVMKYTHLSAKEVAAIATWRSGSLNLDKITFGNFAGAKGRLFGSLENLFEKPTGSIDFNFSANSANDIFSLAGSISNRHPVVERLRRNQSYFSNMDLTGNLTIADDQIPEFILNGKINESEITLIAKGAENFGAILASPSTASFAANVTASNPQSAKLLSQLGFEVLPFDFEESAEINLEISQLNSTNTDVAAKLTSGSTRVALEGTLLSDENEDISLATGEFALEVNSDDIEPLLLSLGQNPPAIGTGQPLKFSADMQTSGEVIGLKNIQGNADGNEFSGELVFDSSKRNLRVNGHLNVDQLELEWFYELALGVRIQTLSDETWNSTSFLPPYEFTPHAELKLSANKLLIPNTETVENFSSKIAIGPGDIAISDISGQWFSGEFLGDLSISNPDGKAFASLKGTLTGADLNHFTWINNEQPVFEGEIDILGHIEGAGTSLSTITESLNGGGLYKISNIKISNFNPDILDGLLTNVDKQGLEITPETIADLSRQLVSESDYNIESLSLPFTITGGQQRLSSFKVDDALFSLTGEAKFNIPTRKMDVKVDVLHDPQLEIQTGATSELTYIFDGPIEAPSRSVDANAMSNFLSIRAYERERRRVELLQASILEKQSLRREISLVKDQQFKREEQARLKAEEEARILAEQEALRLAKEKAEQEAEEKRLKALEQARIAEEEKKAKRLAEAQKRAEEEEKAAELKAQLAAEEAERLAKEQEQKAAAAKEEKAKIKTENWENSVERILRGDQDSATIDGIIVLPLNAPTSE